MLSQEHINALFAFCEKKRVEYYDVQVELVDHLANAIEDKMEKEPQTSFEQALGEVYKQFGIFGFSKIVAEYANNVYNHQRKTFYRLVKEQFQWPKAVILITSIAIFYMVFTNLGYAGIFGGLILIMVLAIILLIYTRKDFRDLRKTSKKKVMLMVMFYNSGWILLPFYLQSFIELFPDSFAHDAASPLKCLFYAIFCAVEIVLLIAQFQTYQRVKQEVVKAFPDLFAI
jgi:hypothetical protein